MDAKQCPWCQRWFLKDAACNYIFACGLDDKNRFHVGQGCGKSWCWKCGKKFCGLYYDPITGSKLPTARENHDMTCCTTEYQNQNHPVVDFDTRGSAVQYHEQMIPPPKGVVYNFILNGIGEPGFKQADFCEGGHNSHASKRW